jgi:hypothetical protein
MQSINKQIAGLSPASFTINKPFKLMWTDINKTKIFIFESEARFSSHYESLKILINNITIANWNEGYCELNPIFDRDKVLEEIEKFLKNENVAFELQIK